MLTRTMQDGVNGEGPTLPSAEGQEEEEETEDTDRAPDDSAGELEGEGFRRGALTREDRRGSWWARDRSFFSPALLGLGRPR